MAYDTGNIIEVKNFGISFASKTIIKSLSFNVKRGETFGLLGSNGSGKTTTIRALLGLYQPDAGKLLINGKPFDPNGETKSYGIWDGYFDCIIESIKPTGPVWDGFLYHYHLVDGWYDEDRRANQRLRPRKPPSVDGNYRGITSKRKHHYPYYSLHG